MHIIIELPYSARLHSTYWGDSYGRLSYYVALPFIRGTDGYLIAGDAMECQSPTQAIARADRCARDNAGGVAFSRTGDPTLGDFDGGDFAPSRLGLMV